MRRATLALGVAAALAIAAPAEAHVEVKSTTPRSGGSAAKSLGSVTVTFTGPLRRGTLKVTGPGGRTVSIGSGGRDPRNIRRLLVELRSPLRAGSYRARWSIKAADGHSQSGSFRFRVRG